MALKKLVNGAEHWVIATAAMARPLLHSGEARLRSAGGVGTDTELRVYVHGWVNVDAYAAGHDPVAVLRYNISSASLPNGWSVERSEVYPLLLGAIPAPLNPAQPFTSPPLAGALTV